MGERELREKYGGKLDKAINRAIRAEVAGGNEALDTLTQLAGAARHSHWKDKKGRPTPEAEAYYKHQREVVERMEAEVRRKWDIPPDKPGRRSQDDGAVPPRPSRRPAGPRAAGATSGKPKAGSGGPRGPRTRTDRPMRGPADRGGPKGPPRPAKGGSRRGRPSGA